MKTHGQPVKPSLSLATALLLFALTSWANSDSDALWQQALETDRLHSLLVMHKGQAVVELERAGPGLSAPANIKSVSKTVLSMLGGMAIDRGIIDGVDSLLVDLLGDRFPDDATPGAETITFGQALSMQAGLESTSGRNYGRWVQSDNWVNHALTRPMIDQPGGRMIYSTGATHLAAAALVEASGQSLADLARDWLGEPLNLHIPDWMTDPQGIHFGGNEMQLSPRALAQLGELYRLDGQINGQQVISSDWIAQSWQANGRSPWTGDDYGYGWFITHVNDLDVFYGRGYGGQALFVVPEAELTIAITSNPNPPSSGWQFRQLLTLVNLAIDHYHRH